MTGPAAPHPSFFDIWSRFYDAPLVQRAVYRPVQQVVLQELQRARVRRVVDVGCGTGILTDRLCRELGADLVVGCDFSFGMLQQATTRRAGAWVQADAVHLPVRSGAVDAVVSTESFHWFPDPDAALRELRRALAPGGRLVIGMVNVRTAAAARAATAMSSAVGQPARWPTRSELRRRLTEAGLRVLTQRRVARLAGIALPTVVTVAVRDQDGG